MGSPAPAWSAASRRASTALRVSIAVAVIAAAYHHSLVSLLLYLSSDTPLAYVGLVPALAVGMALVKARPKAGELRLPDRQFDWIIGVPLLGVAVLLAVVLPDRLSYSFWTNRLDLLGLPLFAAGVVALLFGSRVLYRVRLPILFLVLAWPFPYEHAMGSVLSLTTRLALWGVARGLPLVGGGELVADSLYRVGHGSEQFTVNIAPSCAGANSAVGFLIVGGAAAALLYGPRLKKLAWLALGVLLMLGLNIGRLLLLFWAGDRYGQDVMMNSLHPYAGLGLFILGCLAMIALLPRFGMSLGATSRNRGAKGPSDPEAPATEPVVAPSARRGTRTAFALVLGLAVLLGGLNADLARFDPFGPAEAADVTTASALHEPVAVPGWTGIRYQQVDWAKQYFGATSDWWRYVYETAPAPNQAARSMFVDVVNVADVQKFSTYGLEACYRFHGYKIVSSRRVDVGVAAPAQTISYLNAETDKVWTVVSWVSPVASPGGRRFERVTLLASVDARGKWQPESNAATANLVSFARSFTAGAEAKGRSQPAATVS